MGYRDSDGMLLICPGGWVRLGESEVDAYNESWVRFQEVVAPKVEVPIVDGIVSSYCQVDVLIELPGMNGSEHGSQGLAALDGTGITEIFVVGKSVVCLSIDNPPGIGTPEKTTVASDGTILVECRCEVGELETVIQVERGGDYSADVIPFADAESIAHQTAPIGTMKASVEIDTSGKMIVNAILEGGISLLMIDARTGLDGSVAIEFAVAHSTSIIGNLRHCTKRQQQECKDQDGLLTSKLHNFLTLYFGISMTMRQPCR